jgi:hypothetical protein
MIQHKTNGKKRVVIERSYSEAVGLLGWQLEWCYLKNSVSLQKYLSRERDYQ